MEEEGKKSARRARKRKGRRRRRGNFIKRYAANTFPGPATLSPALSLSLSKPLSKKRFPGGERSEYHKNTTFGRYEEEEEEMLVRQK